MIESKVGPGFLTDLDRLEGLRNGLDEMTIKQFNAIKLEKKRQLCAVIEQHEGVKLDPGFVFDVQVKRLHEYKRQLMNALSIMDIYFGLKDGSIQDFTPTAFIFGAKAAPGYVRLGRSSVQLWPSCDRRWYPDRLPPSFFPAAPPQATISLSPKYFSPVALSAS